MTVSNNKKELLLQIAIFSIYGWYYHRDWMLYLALVLVIILPFQKICTFYQKIIHTGIAYTGDILKTLSFTLLFIFIIIPLGILIQYNNKKKVKGYLTFSLKRNNDFTKLW
jgi:hypothetical protein